MKTKRPNILIATSLLLVLSALFVCGILLLSISDGTDPGLAITISVGVLVDVLDLVAATGVFVVKRWGMWLTVVASVFALVFAIGGAVLTDPSLTKVLCIVLTALTVLVIVLVMLPSARQAYVTPFVLTGEKAN
jgi:uncharacterized membrane protein (DUF2068 family)